MSRNFQPVSTCSKGNGGFEGKNAFIARCNITPESFPIEYSITGLRNSAATSRMMPMDSASRRFRFRESVIARSSSERRWCQRAACDEERVTEVSFAVKQRHAARCPDAATGCEQDGVTRGCIPLHCRTEARRQIRLSSRYQTELQGRSYGHAIGYVAQSQVRIRLRGRMGARTYRSNAVGRHRTYFDGPSRRWL